MGYPRDAWDTPLLFHQSAVACLPEYIYYLCPVTANARKWLTIWSLGRAPRSRFATLPFLNTSIVGTLITWYWEVRPGLLSMSILMNFTSPAYSVASSSKRGSKRWQWPHHGAQKSASTGPGNLRTSASNVRSSTTSVRSGYAAVKLEGSAAFAANGFFCQPRAWNAIFCAAPGASDYKIVLKH